MIISKVVGPSKYSRVMFEIVELPGSCASPAPEKHYIPCSGRTIMATCYFFHDFKMKINENWLKTDKQVKDEKIYGLHINFLWTSNLIKTSQIKPKVISKQQDPRTTFLAYKQIAWCQCRLQILNVPCKTLILNGIFGGSVCALRRPIRAIIFKYHLHGITIKTDAAALLLAKCKQYIWCQKCNIVLLKRFRLRYRILVFSYLNREEQNSFTSNESWSLFHSLCIINGAEFYLQILVLLIEFRAKTDIFQAWSCRTL